MPEVDVARTLRFKALDLLARREHSKAELRRKLTAAVKDATEEQVEATLSQAVDDGLQSDERYVYSFVRAKAAKGQGPLKLKQELAQKGVQADLVAQALDSHSWFEVAAEVYAKKFKEVPPADYQDKQKRLRFMAYRGFDTDTIYTLFGDE